MFAFVVLEQTEMKVVLATELGFGVWTNFPLPYQAEFVNIGDYCPSGL